jgi:Fe-S oxidoreductase
MHRIVVAMKKQNRYLLFKGCTYRKFNPIDLKSLPLPPDCQWVEVEEYCCGSNFFLMGNTEMADGLRDLNLRNFQRAEVGTIVTPCPHCYTQLRNYYREHLGEVKILHSVQFLATSLSHETISSLNNEEIVTYHDPCLLGRLFDIYEEPRRILSLVFRPDQIKEMMENRVSAPCCGSGWLVNSRLFRDLAQEIAKSRLRDAEGIGASTLITACPSCQNLFNSTIKEKEFSLKVRDINEVFIKALGYQV